MRFWPEGKGPDQRPVMICEDVNDLTLDTIRFPRYDNALASVVLNKVGRVHLDDTTIPDMQLR